MALLATLVLTLVVMIGASAAPSLNKNESDASWAAAASWADSSNAAASWAGLSLSNASWAE